MKQIVAVVLACLLASSIGAQDLTPLDRDHLGDSLDTLIRRHPASKRTNIALKVVDLETQEVLYDLDGDKLYTPASNLKIYSSAAALALLGPDYRWTTSVVTKRPASAPQGAMPLFLIGGGDPMLDTAELLEAAKQVATMPQVKGSRLEVKVLSRPGWSALPLKGPGWMWDDDPDYYNMSIQSLMLNFNVTEYAASPGDKVGDVPRFVIEPAVYLAKHDSTSPYQPTGGSTTQRGGANTLEIDREPFTREFFASGELPLDAPTKRFRVVVHDPSRWIASVFRAMLASQGMKISPVQTPSSMQELGPDAEVLMEFQGKTLTEAVRHFLKHSENAVGEMLLLTLAERFGDEVSWSAGASVISRWLVEEAGLEEGSFRLVDGSGLSRYNLISADSSIRLLSYIHASQYRDSFFEGLPVYEVSVPKGEVFDGVPWVEYDHKRVYAKPGGMSGVSTISGYVHTLDGRWLAFSLLGNGFIGSAGPVRDLRNQVWTRLICYRPATTASPTE